MALYSDEMLVLAADQTHVGLPGEPTIEGRWANPLCGDAVVVGAVVRGGRFESIGFEAQACAVCAASAVAMCRELSAQSAELFEASLEALERVLAGDSTTVSPTLEALTAVLPFRSRHACVLLPWRALEQALTKQGDAGPAVAQPSLDAGQNSAWRVALDVQKAGDRAALATLIEVQGSSPCPIGSKMVVSSTGQFWGSVSGGCVESAVVQAAVELMIKAAPQSRVFDYQISNSQAGEVGLPCGGRIRVLVAPAPDSAELQRRIDVGAAMFSATSLESGEMRLLEADAAPDGWAEVAPGVVSDEGGGWFVERLGSSERVLLVGGTHIAQKLSRLALELGFEVIVLDPRTALANPERFPAVRIINERPEDVLDDLITPTTSIVMLTHDMSIDDPALRIALCSQARYIAALGSRKTQRARLERLASGGMTQAELVRLRGPAGLAIGAVGAGEIALSILAELVAERRTRPNATQRVGAVVLAAGSSRRAGPANKLLQPFDGVPMVRRVVQTACDAGLAPCVVVLGHEADRVRESLAGLPVEFVENPEHARGMGRSIATGIAVLEDLVDAAVVMLGDMPLVRTEDVERLVAAHQPSTQHLIIAPEAGGEESRRLGNPVLWPRRYFAELAKLDGERGGKHIILRAPGAVLRIPVEHDGVLRDFDTFDDSEHLSLS